MKKDPLQKLVKSLSALPGLGPRSARRMALFMLTNREKVMHPLMEALSYTDENITSCDVCGNLDLTNPCHICDDIQRPRDKICVVAHVADLWAVERTGAYKGQYHVLGGILSALDGVRPDDLRIDRLKDRLADDNAETEEVIIALGATVDGQATAHYLSDHLKNVTKAKISRLAHGVPVGGELDYLDDGTITTALASRAALS